jgi:aminopeptidase N
MRLSRRRGRALACSALGVLVVSVAASCSRGGGVQTPPPSEPPAVEPGRADPPDRYQQAVDVVSYDLELALPDTAEWILGRARLQLVRPRDADDPLVLDFTGLAVERVRVDGDAVPARVEEDRLIITLEGGDSDTLEVDVRYRGVPDDGLFVAPDVHGRPAAFADNWPNRARFWFPGVDHPSDKARVRFTVHAPAQWEVVANGTLLAAPVATVGSVQVPDSASRRTWYWATATPIPTYTMVVGAGELVGRSVGLAACGRSPASARPDRCTEVTWWAFQPDTVSAARAFRRAAQMVDFFTGWIGDFPYEKLANVQSATRFGGMENSSVIFYSGESLARGGNIEGTVAHEIAHQWFGDSVTPADWSHLWLSEGFADYFEALYFESADGAEAFRSRIADYRQAYLASDVTDRPIVDTTVTDLFDLLNENSYQKGALVLHMLRRQLGEEAFREGIRRFYASHIHGNAATEDLQNALEQASGRDLDTFFQQWLFEPGYPVYRVSQGYESSRGEAIIVITQVQRPEWPRFDTPVEIELEWPGGRRRETVQVTYPRETFTFPVPARPQRVTIDPDGWLLHALEGTAPR